MSQNLNHSETFGIGTDIIEIGRIKKAMDSGLFLKKCFTERECAYFLSRHCKAETIAGSFAAKEAVVKTMGTGIGAIGWRDIEILRDSKGRPYVEFSEKACQWLAENHVGHFKITISHCRDYAVAFCIAQCVYK